METYQIKYSNQILQERGRITTLEVIELSKAGIGEYLFF